jgi:hypothetical protein
MSWNVKGTYFENCHCDAVHPCIFLSAPTTGGGTSGPRCTNPSRASSTGWCSAPTGQDGVTRAAADALQRSHFGHTQAALCEERWDQQ